MTKLKPKTSDTYPMTLVDDIKKGKFQQVYSEVLGLNFEGSAWEPGDRLFDQLMVTD